MSILTVENLEKSYGALKVLKGISFSLEEGEVLGIIGSSGSGKSTMLRCISKLETISAGRIEIAGKTMVETTGGTVSYAKKDVLRQIGLDIGMVFQNFNLFPHFNVMKNITAAQVAVLKRDPKESQKIAMELLETMGLADKALSYPSELSGGQQQRVSIARALAIDPKIMLFDEPTSALDPELTQGVLQVIKSLAAKKMTMIVVTHEMSFARDISDRIIFMDGGLIVEQGPARSVIDNPQEKRTQAFLQTFKD